ncbi:FadR/GntR family transcriptional regulator [Rhizobium sp. P44RR-XXIV]|uniref:FadR/GntR family transcriptional regulator n=1 Tax=Rhizobium sp. P44RR-XXIV TaxID=1921145 RepID=UPI000987D642|nr:FadR/GntR family transcriptional regulator [Rhizobium sp. P44RR-XXIV]TIX90362.1 FadR family transcriptional regulator [Rhizobium sp. P44RR-XXIV]
MTKPNRTMALVEALGVRIASGQIAPGSYLPSETELEHEFGVSRTVVREAAKILSAKGLVTVRQRTGTRVEPREKWQWLDAELIGWLSNGRISHAELLAFAEVREIVEPGAVALAALRASTAERETIMGAYRRMEESQDDPVAAVAADKEFHLSILAATHNPVLQSLRQPIESILDAVFPHTVGAFSFNLENHHAVAHAIMAKDAVAARAAMEILLRETTRFLESLPKSPMKDATIG